MPIDPAEHRRLVLDLALRLRELVLPELGSHAGRSVAGDGAGGDLTFAVDELAEASLAEFLAERAPRIAFYSEDRGLVAPGDATDVLVVDPIDGTRPAMAGLESACVAVALAPLGRRRADDGRRRDRLRGRDQVRRLVPGRPGVGGRVDAAGAAQRRRRMSAACSGPTASAAGRCARRSRCSAS